AESFARFCAVTTILSADVTSPPGVLAQDTSIRPVSPAAITAYNRGIKLSLTTAARNCPHVTGTRPAGESLEGFENIFRSAVMRCLHPLPIVPGLHACARRPLIPSRPVSRRLQHG